MLQLNRIETSTHSDLGLYKINNTGFETQLKKIHNNFAVYINAILKDLREGEITNKALLYEGTEKYDGQQYILLEFINQIKRFIRDSNKLNIESKNAKLVILRDFIEHLSTISGVPYGLTYSSMEFINIAQNQLTSKPKPVIKSLKQIRQNQDL